MAMAALRRDWRRLLLSSVSCDSSVAARSAILSECAPAASSMSPIAASWGQWGHDRFQPKPSEAG
ncbi:hypothetical protein MUK42_37425 [Musa troglodytarum]|uniref:Uncharacterized protein n=1 Tax=Musa troglodytarum TaxID=320322 RepID=A0A9E7G9M5_9LILI|nr:hypothetical protein MUK42_37425 [Musa troglodytarum]